MHILLTIFWPNCMKFGHNVKLEIWIGFAYETCGVKN